MIDGREKLSKVKGNHTNLELGMPSCLDDVSEEATSILGEVLTNTLELVGMEDSMFGCFKLQPIGEHSLKCFALQNYLRQWINIKEIT
jgi:hypothetical protein